MLNLRGISRVCILGGGTAGWFAALHLRQVFGAHVEVMVVSSAEVPIVGVGEGGILNFMDALYTLDIPFLDFIQETGAVHKLGFVYEGWRKGRQDKQDRFYHMFPVGDKERLWEEYGYYPLLSALANHNIPISYVTESIGLREVNTQQDTLTKMFMNNQNKHFASSFHFDTFRVGQYLKKIAIQRGIVHKEGIVSDIVRGSETGLVSSVVVNGDHLDVDFLVDASGLSRLAIGKKMAGKWCSFADSLVMNRAIPFHLKHTTKNPDLVTRSIAMNAGWVWQIPLQERIGAGYVFNSDYISPDQAVAELEGWLGSKVEPMRTISFDAGFYEKVWQGNVLAVGLASGFVEPLEATSIGQMLAQIQTFSNLIIESAGIISQPTIDYFNRQNAQSWHGIRDFIRMHYDTGRMDTPFWKGTSDLPMSDKYKQLKQCWQERSPRKIDFVDYEMDGFSHFNVYSWFAVGQAVGVIPPTATALELYALSADKKQKLAKNLQEIKQRLKIN